MSAGAWREYEEAKAAYAAALARLKAAKAALPPRPSRTEIRDAKYAMIYQAYMAGEHNHTELARRFGVQASTVRFIVDSDWWAPL